MKCFVAVITGFLFAGLSSSSVIPSQVKIETEQAVLKTIRNNDTLIFANVVSTSTPVHTSCEVDCLFYCDYYRWFP